MKKFRLFTAKIGIIFLIPILFPLNPVESKAQNYNYKITRNTVLTYVGGGIWVIKDECTHGIGLCGPAAIQ